MKNIFAVIISSLVLINMVSCAANNESSSSEQSTASSELLTTSATSESSMATDSFNIDEASVRKVVNALCGAGMLGKSWENLEATDNGSLYDFNSEGGCPFISFYCVLTPDYPTEISSSIFDPLMQKYFNVSPQFLHKFKDYHSDRSSYWVSPDVSVDIMQSQVKEYFIIDSIVHENKKITVSYRILWGDMAGSGDGTDSAYEGYVILQKNENIYSVNSVNVTLNDSAKYD